LKQLVIPTALALVLMAGAANAKSCRDAAGHFAACPAPASAPVAATARCRAANGAFAKCPAPVAPPMASVRTAGAAARNATAVAPLPAGAVTARCRDGSMSRSQHRSGSCSRHGGVAAWL